MPASQRISALPYVPSAGHTPTTDARCSITVEVPIIPTMLGSRSFSHPHMTGAGLFGNGGSADQVV